MPQCYVPSRSRRTNTIKKKLKILLVEGEETDTLAFARALEKHGHQLEIHAARDGREALRLLFGDEQTNALRRPYIIVTNWELPDLSGRDLIERVRENKRLRDTLIFVLSSSDQAQDIASAYRHNITGYVNKDPDGENIENFIQLLASYAEAVIFPV